MATTKIDSRQIQDSGIEDLDNDTKVECESSADEDKIRFDTAGVERLVINSDGAIAFGNASTSGAPASFNFFNFKGGGVRVTAHNFYCDNDRGVLWGDSSVSIKGNAASGTESLTVRANYNAYIHVDGINDAVGVGTTTPTQNLHVVGSGNTTLRVQGSDGYYGAINVKGGTGDSAWVWQPANTSDLRFYVNGADRMHLDNDGNVGVGTTTPSTILSINGPIATAISTKTANYTVTASDSTILANASNASVVITLPAVAGCVGRIYTVKCTAKGEGNAMNVASNGSETIDGSTNDAILDAFGAVTLQSDGSGWHKIAEIMPPSEPPP